MGSIPSLRLNETFDVLQHPYRRVALYHLEESEGNASVQSLAKAIKRRDESADGNVLTALRHRDIPKLEAAGVITHEEATDRIELADTSGVEHFLEQTAAIDEPRPLPQE